MSIDIRINAFQPDNAGCGNKACCPKLPLSPGDLGALSDAFLAVLDDFGLEGDVSVKQIIEAEGDNYDNYSDDDADDEEDDEEEDEEDEDFASPCMRKCSVCHPDDDNDDD